MSEAKTHVIDGKTYVEVERLAKVGEKVVVIAKGTHAYEIGDITEIVEVEESNRNQTRRGENYIGWLYEKEYRVLEPVDQAPTNTDDLIANLIRRVASLESQLRDVQGNVERQGVEIANVTHLAKSNEADIRTLDERTQAETIAKSLYEGIRRRGVIR